MNTTTTPYGACEDLFARYPLAVETVSYDGDVCTMVLGLPDGTEGMEFFRLTHQAGADGTFFSLWHWHGDEICEIEADGSTSAPDTVMNVVNGAIPCPRNGALLGYVDGGAVTALIVQYTDYTPEAPWPHFMPMVPAHMPEELWPSFIGEGLLGSWFWDLHREGRIVNLAGLIAGTSGTVFWASSPGEDLRGGVLAVAAEVDGPKCALPEGVYAYYADLRSGARVPSVDEVCANGTDLAPRFTRMAA